MSEFDECPNCRHSAAGTAVFKCLGCYTVFCKRCNGGAVLIFCPKCESSVAPRKGVICEARDVVSLAV